MQVPFVDLRAQARELHDELGAVFESVTARAAYTLGPECTSFEAAFAELCGTRFCAGVSSGTDALRLALQAVGVGSGDEVIVPVNSFIATAESVSHTGAKPVFVDCLPDTANIDPAVVEASITRQTRAIVPVHLYGQPADVDPILEIAARHHLTVVEDACQAHGAAYKGRPCGSLGAAAAFSFYPGKNLGALGDGGAVTTSSRETFDTVTLLRSHGERVKSVHTAVGYCNRLHNLQAGFLAAKLPHLSDWNRARRRAAARYDELLAGLPGVKPIAVRADVVSARHLYVVLVDRRDRIRDKLDDDGIGTGVHYPTPLHLTPAYAHLGYRRGDLPVAEAMAPRLLSLPLFPEIADEQIEYVVERLRTHLAAL